MRGKASQTLAATHELAPLDRLCAQKLSGAGPRRPAQPPQRQQLPLDEAEPAADCSSLAASGTPKPGSEGQAAPVSLPDQQHSERQAAASPHSSPEKPLSHRQPAEELKEPISRQQQILRKLQKSLPANLRTQQQVASTLYMSGICSSYGPLCTDGLCNTLASAKSLL